MTIIEAINDVFPASPGRPLFISRKKWLYIVQSTDCGIKIQPTDSPNGMIVYSDACGREGLHAGWQPTAEDLVADDWVVTW